MHDKPIMRVLNLIADWLIRIVVLNIFMAVLLIPLVTFYAGYKACYNLFVDYTEGKNTSIFSGFWENLKKDFWRNVGIGAMFIFMIIIGFLGAYNYNNLLSEQSDLFYIVGFYITLGVSFLLLMTMLISTTVIYIKEDIAIKELFKISLVITGKYFLRALVIVVLTALPVLLFLEPAFAVIFVFTGLSVPLIINVLLMRKPREFLKGEDRHV